MLICSIAFVFQVGNVEAKKRKVKENKQRYYPPYLHENYSVSGGHMSAEFIELLNQQKNIFVRNLLVSAFELQKADIKYKRKANKLTNNAINCTGLIKELFTNASLSYGNRVYGSKDLRRIASEEEMQDQLFLPKEKSENYYWNKLVNISANFYAPQEKNRKVYDFFKIQSIEEYQQTTGLKNFYPQAGDVLAYYNTKKREGHAVIVVDPMNCVAIDSSPYSFKEGKHGKIKSKEGVQFRYLKSPSCNPMTGEWTSWGKAANKFQVLMRHRNFFEDSKHFLANN